MLKKVDISQVNTELNGLQTDNNTGSSRLLYLAAGEDLGCSLVLFWNFCNSFYLVDPLYANPDSCQSIVEKLRNGNGAYMQGEQFIITGFTPILVGKIVALKYTVAKASNKDGIKTKVLYLFPCGTQEFFDALTANDKQYGADRKFDVAINKDYEGIDNAGDSDYPYAKVWGRLWKGGIYCETIGDGRSTEATDFAIYRHYGFDPMFRIESQGNQIGFGNGLIAFRKTVECDAAGYNRLISACDQTRESIKGLFTPIVDGNGTLQSITQYVQCYQALANLMTNGAAGNWNALGASAEFIQWVNSNIPADDRPPNLKMVDDFIRSFKLALFGSFR